ncbi:PREDICTED: uncharacterized protein LOC109585443 [Amphimedon queenslandica]|uniref:Uncharacterized protein n=1 Tax=Amphimedon queenslandica TaxID=400682 RepID=A0AAN0JJZ1_AMPQE|nr:PREDICTED: uncharacterized protein LOC109585443 [Amphimedon queenslandica]|eukprot:XP_019857087.1 PREDICTED: uncharacterized protein LOC109585443 [Amphimedon queenslandica]
MASKNKQLRKGRRMIPPFTRLPLGLPSGQLIPKYFNNYYPLPYQPLHTSPAHNQHYPAYHYNPYHYHTGPFIGPAGQYFDPSGSYPSPHHSYYQPEVSPQWIQAALLNPMIPYYHHHPTSLQYPIHNVHSDDHWDTPHITELSPPDTPPVQYRAVGVQADRGNTPGEAEADDGLRERVKGKTSKLLDQVLFEKLIDRSIRTVSQPEIDNKVKTASINIMNKLIFEELLRRIASTD